MPPNLHNILYFKFQGGFKSVLWTDTLQASIMVVGFFTLFVKGSLDIGGISQVMNISMRGGRLNMTE